MKITQKLLIAALIIGLIPMITIGSVAIVKIHYALTHQAFNQLQSIREIKKAQLEYFFKEKQRDIHILLEMIANLKQHAFQQLQSIQEHKKAQLEWYFQDIFNDIQVLSQSYSISQALYQFNRAFQMTQGDTQGMAWRITEDRFGLELKRYQQKQGYEDLLLINKQGDIVYSVAKRAELGQNMSIGTLKNTHLHHGFQQGLTQLTIEEFQPYTFANSKQTAFIIAPVEHFGTPIGVLAISISSDSMNQIVQRHQGMGRTGESYIVGNVKGKTVYRSHRMVKQRHRQTMGEPKQGVDINKALAGQAGIAIKISENNDLLLGAYAPLSIPGLNWCLITTIELEELLTPQLIGQNEDFFKKYLNQYGYEDLFLIHPQGKIFYSIQHKPEYATNILTGKYANTQLGHLVQEILQTKRFSMSDYAPYEPSNYQPNAFLAQPLLDNNKQVELIVALQLSDNTLNQIMQQRAGMGQTGETYLVGSDKLMRSNSYLSPNTHSIKASFANPLLGQVDTPSSRAALAGKIFEQVTNNYQGDKVLSTATPITVSNYKWALITEIHQSEALTPLTQIEIWLSIFFATISLLTFLTIKRLTQKGVAPLLAINQHLKKLSQGNVVTQDLTYCAPDEIGELTRSTQQLKKRLEKTIEQAQAIANGNYHDAITTETTETTETLLCAPDQLSLALTQMTRTLCEVTTQNAQQQWLKNGQAQLQEQITGHQDLVKIAKNAISFLTTYLNAQMGLFYLAPQENKNQKAQKNTHPHLKLIASYAFNHRKPFTNEIQFGDNLVGQAALEQQMIIISGLPNDYTLIQSGQGQAVPHSLLITPFSHNNTIEGVIELATLHEFSPLQQEFITTVMPYIATAINLRQIYDQEKTKQ
jgi:methyl-accepting chemotaxis protein